MTANVRFEDFELDPGAYRLRQNDAVVRLERIPFELLCLLVERGGEIVTREEILDRVWGKGVFVDGENSINTAVRKIRRALNDDADSPRFVATIPAKGYRFIAPVVTSNGEVKAHGELADELPQIQVPAHIAPEVEKRGTLTYLSVAAILVFVLATLLFVRYMPLLAPAHGKLAPSQQQAVYPPLPSIPSIAVLPFINLSNDPGQEYFSDGITDDLITDLSRLPGLFVIARDSTFSYKGKPIQVQEIGRELGVKYVLEGSARKIDDQVRINVQLVEASTGEQVWGQRYDNQFHDIFKLQDEIVRSVIATLNVQLPLLEKGIVLPQRTNNLEAYDYYLRGIEYFLSLTPDGFTKSRNLLEKAIDLDSGYADPYGTLSWICLLGYIYQWDKDKGALDRAADLINKAIALDDSDGNLYAVRGWIAAEKGRRGDAIADGERAVSLAPNSAFAWDLLANLENLLCVGKPEEALAHAERAIRLDPRYPVNYRLNEGCAYNRMGRYAEAVDALKKANPSNPWTHVNLAYDYIELGREPEARAEAAEVLRISPRFSLEKVTKTMPGDTWKQRYIADLRKAGLK